MGDERCDSAEYDWGDCEPTYYQVLAAVYLEAKGFTFGEHFDLANVEECAENVYRAELSMDGKQ
jgi:hypothetical protein